MRIIVVWIVAFILFLTVSISWYISLPVAFALSSSIEGEVSGLPAALNALRIVEYVVILWGPIWDIFILVWAFMESHRIDITSEVYG